MRGDRAELQQASEELKAAALASRNPGIVALAHRLCQERSVHPAASEARHERRSALPVTASHTVSQYLAGATSLEERARQALAVLGHYAGCSEGYLYLDRDASLQLTASLDEHTPPDSLLTTLQRMATANDAESCTQIDADYCAYRLDGGFAVLRAVNTQSAPVPATLLSEVGLSLGRAADARG
jgi:hypothetical protein